MTLHGSRLESPSDFPSNGVPARGYLEASSLSSSETVANTGELIDLPSIGLIYSESIDDKLLKNAQVNSRSQASLLAIPNSQARMYARREEIRGV
jgi:hypothetical protein